MNNFEKVYEMDNVNMHFFKMKKKTNLSFGPCSVETSLVSLKLISKSTTFEITKLMTVARHEENQYMTFLYLPDEKRPGINSFSLYKNDPALSGFETILRDKISVVELDELPSYDKLRVSISVECPIHHGCADLGSNTDEKIDTIGKKVGHAIGQLGAKIGAQDPTVKVEKKVEEVPVEGEQKTSEVDEKLKPINDKIKEIGKAIDESENPVVKGAKQFTQKIGTAINQGYQKGYVSEKEAQKKAEEEAAQKKAAEEAAKKAAEEAPKAEGEAPKAEGEAPKSECNPEKCATGCECPQGECKVEACQKSMKGSKTETAEKAPEQPPKVEQN